jgi:hypothetical protein
MRRPFHKVSILDVLPGQERHVRAKVESFAPNYVLSVSEDDLFASLVDEFTLDIPVLDEAGIQVEYGEHQVKVSREPMRFVDDHKKPFDAAGTRVTFVIRFSGDPSSTSKRSLPQW